MIRTYADCQHRRENILHLTNCSDARKKFFKGTEDQSVCKIAEDYGDCAYRCVYLITMDKCPAGFQR